MFELMREFFKIGLLTFGGGSAATPIIHERLVREKNWINENEFVDIVAMANVLPGPSMIQMASLIGLKKTNKVGAILSAFAISAPSIILFVLVMELMHNLVDPILLAQITLPIFILIGLSMFLSAKQVFKNNHEHGFLKNGLIVVMSFSAIVFFSVPAVVVIIFVIIITVLSEVMFS